eukprot:7640017-Pyramimonas_sp.AAC.1
MWSAAVDFKRALGSIARDRIWESMAQQSAPRPCVRLLATLCERLAASVHADRPSRQFDVLRGTKGGDSLSSLLFNCVSE